MPTESGTARSAAARILNNSAGDTALSAADRGVLGIYSGLVDGLVSLYGRHCEAVLYSLAGSDAQASWLAGGNRQPGAAMTEAEQRLLAELSKRDAEHLSLTYQRLGTPVRSMVQRLRTPAGEPAGLLFVHLDLGAPLHELMADWLAPETERPQASAENFSNNVEELVTLTVERTIDAINADPDVANNAKNKQIVTTLFEKGIFDIKDAIAMVSDKLNISKHTVYLYIRQKKRDDEETSPDNQENP